MKHTKTVFLLCGLLLLSACTIDNNDHQSTPDSLAATEQRIDTMITKIEDSNTSEEERARLEKELGNIEKSLSRWEMLAEDCLNDEKYNEQDKRCYPIEENTNDFSTTDIQHNDFFGKKDKEENSHNHGDDFSIYAKYTVNQDDKLRLITGKSEEDDQKVWSIFKQLIPATARKDLTHVNFGNNPESDTYAFVSQNSKNHLTWNINFNLGVLYKKNGEMNIDELQQTMIHEFAHIITLRKGQVNLIAQNVSDQEWTNAQRTCKQYFLQEGCLDPQSYMQGFLTRFWTDEELTRARDNNQPDEYSEEEYVSDYATTNPGEDIAESFTFFVLKQKQTGSSEREQKINYFYKYPELIKLRSRIRSHLSSTKK